jgi:hypothetical protein
MASPIDFKPKKVDPRLELQRRLQAAPTVHAESILAALDMLEAAHRKGLLGLAQGAISSKDAVFAKMAEYAKQPESLNTLRNLLILAKLFGNVDPEKLSCISNTSRKAPSFWKTFRSFWSADARRGFNVAAELLNALGSSNEKPESTD